MYRKGTSTRVRSGLTSQSRTACTRRARTLGPTQRRVWQTSTLRATGASAPIRKRSSINSDGGSRNNKGRESNLARNESDQVRIGLVTNPAQTTSPAKFAGCLAANITANGDEKDSAKSTNGSALGITSPTQGRSSEQDKNR